MRGLAWVALAVTIASMAPAGAAGPVLELRGTGVQIYMCARQASGFGWTLKAPDARLLDASGTVAGRHFAGPSWQARDGSTVVGELLASGSSPRPDAIPWLLLRAKSHSGDGVFAAVAYIARTHTEGGRAPVAGCSSSQAGIERRVDYTALYDFFPQP